MNHSVVLLVDDDDDDVLLVTRSLKSVAPTVDIQRVDNGLDAMSWLRQQDTYSTAPRPALVLLDLNMPLMSGREVLQEIKSDPQLTDIPVVVLTTSDDQRDIAMCNELHVDRFVTKPASLVAFREVLGDIAQRWLSTK